MQAKRTNQFDSIHRALFVLAAVALLCWGVGAKDDEKLKIGVIDLDQAITSTTEGRKAREEFDRKKRSAESQLFPLMESYQEMMKEFDSKKFVLSDSVENSPVFEFSVGGFAQ